MILHKVSAALNTSGYKFTYMKTTLVIHPKDQTTDFLSEIYLDKNWTVINSCEIHRKEWKTLVDF